ncbi:DNA topoisomerase 2-binding protein 1-A isoform X2 [Periplaneta americana]|uniref:DNA topoisomerase 2-binding protein 1-A isoform X2 n=1 Tax=Periplaneta americana TaxID=6978 RepID=UPI0037E833FD
MSDEESVNIYFVIRKGLKTENQCSDDMKMAFQTCGEQEFSPKWISEGDCSALKPTKRDAFVFEQFEGELFSRFRNLKCVLLGPRCLLTCLIEGSPIPKNPSPIFTTAMRGLIVSTTNFAGQEKEDLINKIEYMGALLAPKLIKGTTHLVARNVLSTKYEKAVEKSLPVMTEKWVISVWEASCKRNVHASDPEFQEYKCPVFHGLTITCSNLPRQEKEKIKKLINDNGGTFCGQLELNTTNLLVISNPVGDKFQYAREWNLPCVQPSWVYDSMDKGYAVPIDPHVTPYDRKCSTPTNDDTRTFRDFSIVSTISSIARNNATHINETVSADTTIQSFLRGEGSDNKKAEVEQSGFKKYADMVEKLDLREAKKAGAFLDGCNVFLSGFNTEQTEKLRRILNGGGATRFNEISDNVTHVIVGQVVPADLKILRSSGHRPYLLTVEWVIESIKLKCPAPEDKFLCTDGLLQSAEPPSPLSKKGVQLLRRLTDRPIPSLHLPFEETTKVNKIAPSSSTDVVDQYLHNTTKECGVLKENMNDNTETTPFARKASSQIKGALISKEVDINKDEDVTLRLDNNTCSEQDLTQDSESTISPIFNALTFFVIDFDDNVKELLLEVISSHGGSVVGKNFKGIADYAIVPINGATFSQTATEIVTQLWVEDCHLQDDLVPVSYYHRPIVIDLDKKPLSGCVMGITSYTGKEREFIFTVAELMGAITQEMFARKDNEKKNVLASTHLICSEPGSQKYNAALKWKLPAVTHEWILMCAKEGRRVKEEPYLIGESSCSSNMSCKQNDVTGYQKSNLKAQSPAISNLKTKSPAISNLKAPSPAVSNLKAPSPAVSNLKAPSPAVSNLKAPSPAVSNIKTHSPIVSNQKAQSPAVSKSRAVSNLEAEVSVTADNSQGCIATKQTPKSDLKPVNKRVAELQNKAAVTSHVSPANCSGSSSKEHNITPSSNIHHGFGFSQESPLLIPKMAETTPKNDTGWPADPNESTPKGPYHVSTPDTPYGQVLKPNPSPQTRKNWKKWIDNFPQFEKEDNVPRKRKLSTPLSELKRRCWEMILPKDKSSSQNVTADVQDNDGRQECPAGEVSNEQTSGSSTSSGKQAPSSGSSLFQNSDGAPGKCTQRSNQPSSGVNMQLEQLNQMLSYKQSEDSDSDLKVKRVRSSDAATHDHSGHEKPTDSKTETPVKESQGIVEWDDPVEINDRKRRSESSNSSSQQIYKFMLSGIMERDHYESIIQSLGGEVTDKSTFDSSATHIVCSRPVRSEKLLASIASGKWALHKSYLDASQKQQHFIQEEEYEWGNPSAMSLMRDFKPGSIENDLALSAHRWRCRLTGSTSGAFMGMTALVCISREREEAFKRLILAGGGRLVDFSNLDEATHCFVELNKVPLPIDLSILVKKRIPCVPALYLNDYLIKNPPPQAHDCVVPEYRQLLQTL